MIIFLFILEICPSRNFLQTENEDLRSNSHDISFPDLAYPLPACNLSPTPDMVQWAVCSAYSVSTARLEHSGLRKKKGGASTSNHEWTDFGERAKLVSLCMRDCMNSSPFPWSRSGKPAWLLQLSPVLQGNPRVLGSYKNFTQYRTKKRCSFLTASVPMKAFFSPLTSLIVCLCAMTITGTSN